MSKKRFIGRERDKLKYGKNGRALCRYCESPVPPPKRTFCSKECVHQWSLRKSSSYVRACVFRRDKGICAACKTDCHKLRQSGHRMKYEDYKQFAKSLNMPYKRASWWDADHIVPVVEGGGECGLENYRTLCIPCHRKVTKDLQRKLSFKRKFETNAIPRPPKLI
jgi:5-methylcytosine-specific restriction protein A